MKNKLFLSFSSMILLSSTLLPVCVTVAESTTNFTVETSSSQADLSTSNVAESVHKIVEESEEVDEPKKSTEETTSEDFPSKNVHKSDKIQLIENDLHNIDGIITTVTAPTKFKTYTDPVTGVKPDELSISVAVSIGQPDIEGATIELPYGFIPDTSKPNFEHFTMTAPIFTLVTPEEPSSTSIVESYEESSNKDKLLIHLKKTTTTVETLNFKFAYNSEYDAKIPIN